MLLLFLGVPGSSSRSTYTPGIFVCAMMIMGILSWDSGMMIMTTLFWEGLGGLAIFAL